MTLADSVFGLYHSFVCGKTITGTEHQASKHLLDRMAAFYRDALQFDSLEEDGACGHGSVRPHSDL